MSKFTTPLEGRSGSTFAAIVKVTEPDYVPPGVSLRMRISAHIFTADITREQVLTFESDDKVSAVSIATPLR